MYFRTGSLPVAARAAMIGMLAVLGLAVAGLRGPAGQAQSQAQTRPGGADQASGRDGPRGNAAPLDLSLLPAETKMLLALQPAALLERDEVKALVSDLRQRCSCPSTAS